MKPKRTSLKDWPRSIDGYVRRRVDKRLSAALAKPGCVYQKANKMGVDSRFYYGTGKNEFYSITGNNIHTDYLALMTVRRGKHLPKFDPFRYVAEKEAAAAKEAHTIVEDCIKDEIDNDRVINCQHSIHL